MLLWNLLRVGPIFILSEPVECIRIWLRWWLLLVLMGLLLLLDLAHVLLVLALLLNELGRVFD